MNEKRIKMLASLAHAKFRNLHGFFLVEGRHAVMSLLETDWPVETIIVSNEFDPASLPSKAVELPLERVGQKTIDRIASTSTPQDIVAVAMIPENGIEKTVIQDRIFIADGVKDPGNMGTMIRTAEALGFGAIITTEGAVDIFNPKVVRGTQGSMFFIEIAQRMETGRLLKRIKEGHTLYALAVDGETDLSTVKIDRKSALVVGSEIAGVGRELLTAADYRVRIPISGKSESLNAAIAAGIAMYLFGSR